VTADINEARRQIAEAYHDRDCSTAFDRGDDCDCYLASMRAALDELERCRARLAELGAEVSAWRAAADRIPHASPEVLRRALNEAEDIIGKGRSRLAEQDATIARLTAERDEARAIAVEAIDIAESYADSVYGDLEEIVDDLGRLAELRAKVTP